MQAHMHTKHVHASSGDMALENLDPENEFESILTVSFTQPYEV